MLKKLAAIGMASLALLIAVAGVLTITMRTLTEERADSARKPPLFLAFGSSRMTTTMISRVTTLILLRLQMKTNWIRWLASTTME